MDNLGKKGRDKVTGFEGIITGKVSYLFGREMYVLDPSSVTGRRLPESEWFDKDRIEIIGDGISPEEVHSEAQ